MKTLQINTTQNVKINFTLASVSHRILAYLIDLILKFLYAFFLVKFSNLDSYLNFYDDNWSANAIFTLFSLPIILYSLLCEFFFKGQTLGKYILKIKVVKNNGFKPSFTDYLIRWFLRIIDINIGILLIIYLNSLNLGNEIILIFYNLFFVLGPLVAIISISLSKNNQRIGDLAANTIVIHLKDEINFSHTILEDISKEYVPTYKTVLKLSDNDARIIKDTYLIAKKNNDHKTLAKLTQKIEEVIDEKSLERNYIVFIDKILKDYNYYTQKM